MIDLLRRDRRVGNPRISCIDGSTFRTFIIELDEEIDVNEFIESYNQYRFRGSLLHWHNFQAFTFDVSLIYPITFYEILKSDPRVLTVKNDFGWSKGRIGIHADKDFVEIMDEFLADYSHFGELRWGRDIGGKFFYAPILFDHIIFNEFHFLKELQQDERIIHAGFDGLGTVWCESYVFVSQYDETVRSMTRVAVYPNPVRGDIVKFQIKSDSFKDNDNVEISIYNIRGQRIFLSNEIQAANGNINFVWNSRDNNNQPIASSVYLYRVNINNNTHTGRLLILK